MKYFINDINNFHFILIFIRVKSMLTNEAHSMSIYSCGTMASLEHSYSIFSAPTINVFQILEIWPLVISMESNVQLIVFAMYMYVE